MSDFVMQSWDTEGNLLDTNLDSALIIEGTVLLGNTASGRIELDTLFPMREHFKGIFLMPAVHALSLCAPVEHMVSVYLDRGNLVWRVPDAAYTRLRGGFWHGGAFAGRQFVYGYLN